MSVRHPYALTADRSSTYYKSIVYDMTSIVAVGETCVTCDTCALADKTRAGPLGTIPRQFTTIYATCHPVVAGCRCSYPRRHYDCVWPAL